MGSGAGAGRGAVDATFKLICIAAYAAYVLIGLAVAVVGAVYWSSTLIASGMVSALLIISGIGMVGVGAAAIYGLANDNAPVLGVVWILDVCLFCLFVLFTIIGFMIGMDVRDPTRTSTDNAWGVYSNTELAAQTEWRKTFWDGSYCTTAKVFGGRKQACDAVFKYHATNALLDADSNFTAGTQISDLFADCRVAASGLPCKPSTLDVDIDACAAAALSGTPTVNSGVCSATTTPGSVAGCTYVEEVPEDTTADPPVDGVAEACVPALSCDSADDLRTSCEDCNHKCKEDLIADVKANLKPAAYIVFAVLGFCIAAALINDSMIGDADFGGVLGILGLIFNGAVAFSGFILTIAASIGQYMLTQDCAGADGSCTNNAVYVAIVLGIAVTVLGVLGVLGVQKNRNGGGIASRTALRQVNIVLLCCAFLLSVAGMLLSLAGGGMESINGESEKNFPELRNQMEAQDANYCRSNNVPMTDDECRAKITKELEDNLMTVGIVALIVTFGLFAVILLTFRIIRQLKSDDEESTKVDDFLDNLETQDNPAAGADDDNDA